MENTFEENKVQDVETNECFVRALSRLKESSFEAVASEKQTNDFSKYMHVDRPVQQEFDRVIRKAVKSDKAELILLCGSVGDGKSHMLSYYNQKFPELMQNFEQHNDSTASFYVKRSAMFTLKEVLADFKDDKLGNSKKKLILAINLGTLNNFLESDEENEFKLLKDFVKKEKILDKIFLDKVEIDGGYFHSVNFSDYHLYSLTENGPKSNYMEDLLEKITGKNEDNILRREYRRCCRQCHCRNICPVKINYDFLSNKSVREEIIQIIVESIIKNKLIISTRALLNLIYEMIVDERYIMVGSLEPRKDIEKLNELDYCRALMPNSMFSRDESTMAINFFRYIDPINLREEKIDSFIFEYTNREDVCNIFLKVLPECREFVDKFGIIDFSEDNTFLLRHEMLKLLMRSYRLLGKKEIFDAKDKDYYEYMKKLYAWNTGKKTSLINIYDLVKRGALNWNGRVNGDEIRVLTGNSQSKFQVIQKVSIKADFSNLHDENKQLIDKFSNVMYMNFIDAKTNSKIEVDVDYLLYELLIKISNGYRPNAKDKRLNIIFSNFVENVSQCGNKREIVYIREKNGRDYKLEYNESAECFTFEVM